MPFHSSSLPFPFPTLALVPSLPASSYAALPLPSPLPALPQSANAVLVSEQGPVRRWRLDYRARWKFWKVGGVCENRLWMTTDREAGTVSAGEWVGGNGVGVGRE